MIKLITEGQVESWYHSQILRIPHGKQNPKKRYLTEAQILELFKGKVVVEEKVDGKLKAYQMNTYYLENRAFWMAEILYSKNTMHNHIIKYKTEQRRIWLNEVWIHDNKPEFRHIQAQQNILIYGTIELRDATIDQIYMLLEAFSKLPSHLGVPKTEGLVLKNFEMQLMGKWINDEFEDKLHKENK
jgi:hypothetical protein